MRRWSVLLAAGLVSALAAPIAGQMAPSRSIVYGGDQQFPPYEYRDEEGRPEGFNIHLIRAARSRHVGRNQSGPREDRILEFDAGKTDVIFLS